MKILLVNKFLYPKGGDAICTLNTGRLLSQNQHEVIYWGMKHPANPEYPFSDKFVSQVDYNSSNGQLKKLKAAANILYSFEAKKHLTDVLSEVRPDVAHLNNFAHQISPSILHTLRKHKIPIVVTLHDYKLVCASYLLLNSGEICEACQGGRHYNCFRNGCVKGSKMKSLLNTVEMYLHHQCLQIYDLVDIFIAPSKFMQAKYRQMGFQKRIDCLPNCIDLDDFDPQYEWDEETAVYFGRLSAEKGLVTLIEAFKKFNGFKLKIIGDGPMKDELENLANQRGPNGIRFLGYLSGEKLHREIKKSMAVLLPSECYENYPGTITEAFALGKPVIASNIGGIPELVKNAETGQTFEPGNVEDLVAKLIHMEKNRKAIPIMGRNARKFAESQLNSQKYYNGLMDVYRTAVETTSTAMEE